MVNSRISIGPNAMALSTRAMAIFRAAGFTGRDVDNAASAVISYTLGFVASEVSWRTMVKESGKPVEQWTEEAMAQAIPAAEAFPEIKDLLELRASNDPYASLNESFTFGLESLLDGFAVRLGA